VKARWLVAAALAAASCASHASRNASSMPPVPDGACADPAQRAIMDSGAPQPVRPPLLARPHPAVPGRALANGIQGWVCVRYTIAPDGSISEAIVFAASPSGYFEEAALDSVYRWKYEPSQGSGPWYSIIKFWID
jgi:periplasmic protein TonB